VRQVLNAVASMALNISANPFGDSTIAAMAITGRIIMFIASMMVGIGQGFQPVASYNYGAKKYARIRQSYRFTLAFGMSILCALAVIVYFQAGPLIGLFRRDPEVIAIGTRALRFQCLSIVLQPISIVTNMLFQSIGKSRIASFTASLRTGLYFLPAIIILPIFMGITGVESAQAIADAMASFTCIPLAIHFFHTIPKKNQESLMDQKYNRFIASAR
jgi:Na+-driven multidrug efflux pump